MKQAPLPPGSKKNAKKAPRKRGRIAPPRSGKKSAKKAPDDDIRQFLDDALKVSGGRDREVTLIVKGRGYRIHYSSGKNNGANPEELPSPAKPAESAEPTINKKKGLAAILLKLLSWIMTFL